jgi:LysM repeat protein
VYILAEGDDLALIAGNYKTTVDAIVELNNLPSADAIQAGAALQIPAGDTSANPKP